MATTQTGRTTAAIPWAPIFGIIATVSVFAIAQGLNYPLLSLVLQKQGVSPGMIGLSAAMTPIGFIVSSPLIPTLARRFGAGRTVLTCALLSVLTLAAIGWTRDLYAWFPLRFLLGVVTNPLYVLSEVWMIALAPAEKRGRIMGIYATLISGGFAVGPLCLLLVGAQGWPPFMVGIGAFALCGLCLAAVLPTLPKVDESGPSASVLSFMPLAVLLLFAVVVAAGFEQSILALLPVYGVEHGIDEAVMAALLSAMIAGNVVMQVPLGFLAERLTARMVRLLCVGVTTAGCALLPLVIGTPAQWPFLFIWGGASYGIYTMAIIELGDRFTGAALVAGNAAFSLMWGVGGVAMPPAAGAAMDRLGGFGLPLTLGAVCLLLTIASLLPPKRSRRE